MTVIDRLAAEKGLSDDEVASLLGCPTSRLAHVREGRAFPPHPAICAGYRPLADELGVDPMDLQAMAMAERQVKPKKPRKR